jgi:hypothetical protein
VTVAPDVPPLDPATGPVDVPFPLPPAEDPPPPPFSLTPIYDQLVIEFAERAKGP